jgi:hypothetical protein
MGAETYDVDLSHGGRKIAGKTRESKRGAGLSRILHIDLEVCGLVLYAVTTMTREEQIRKRMNELERQYREARDEKITEELYELARELKKLKKKS